MKTPSLRSRRIAELVKAELARVIQIKLHNKNIGFVSILEVIMSNDLSLAKVYVSVLGNGKTESLEALKNTIGYMRKDLAKKLNLRIVPEIAFFLDERLERGDKVLKLLKEIQGSGPLNLIIND
jgi:ribosome-binding factor A